MVKERFYSLDVFRGMTVALMILVNNPGSWSYIYPPLEHAKWNGLTAADLVFPFFLFAVGNALSFVMPHLRAAGDQVFLKKVCKRSIIIFLIGLGLNWLPFFKWNENHLEFFSWENVRIMGVLQRIAIAYFFSSLMIYYLKPKGSIIASLVILMGYTILCVSQDAHVMENAFGSRFDQMILGESHMYKGEGFTFDPEGLATGITPIVQIIFGYFAGWFIQKKGKNLQMIRQLFLAGLAVLLMGYGWSFISPLSKKIWSSSYVVFTSGLATLILCGLIYMIEMKNIKGFFGRFFDVFGKNPLFIFVLSGFLPRVLSLIRIEKGMEDGEMKYMTPFGAFYEYVCRPLFENEKNASLLYALIFIFFMWFIAYQMDKRKIYIKV